MIEATFNQNKKGQIISFEMTGHADFDEEGLDIICAAASALSINAVNSIEELAGYQPIVEMDDGYLYVEVLSGLSDEAEHVSQLLLKSLKIGLKYIETEYSEFIRVI